MFAPGEGYADPAKVTDWARLRAAQAGARFIRGQVAEITGKTARLDTAQVVPFGAAVVAAGYGSLAVMQSLGIPVPLRASPGILMRTAPLPQVLGPVLATPVLDLWQGPDGSVVMSTALAKTNGRADDLTVTAAEQALGALLPGALTDAAPIKVVDIALRDRPIPRDGFPIVGATGVPGIWLAVMHSGMTLAPVVAQAITDMVLDRAPRHDLSDFALDRDFGGMRERAAL